MYNSHTDCKNQMSRTDVIVALVNKGPNTVNICWIHVQNNGMVLILYCFFVLCLDFESASVNMFCYENVKNMIVFNLSMDIFHICVYPCFP